MGRYGTPRHEREDYQKYLKKEEDIHERYAQEHPGIVKKIKERINQYNSPEAKQERRSKTLDKRSRRIEDLEYKAKKEKLHSVVRKSRQTAPSTIFSSTSSRSTRSSRISQPSYPRHDYSGMDRMLGLGSSKPAKMTRTKKQSNPWGNMDRMFGL
jgi:hypothetical protein